MIFSHTRRTRAALAFGATLSALCGTPVVAAPFLARATSVAPAPDSAGELMKGAAALDAAGDYEAAAEAYGKAAAAYGASGKKQEQADALGKSASMYEKQADKLLAGVAKPDPAKPTPAAAPTRVVKPQAATAKTQAAPVRPAPVAAGAAPKPLETSANVRRNAKGQLAFVRAGVPLSRHNFAIQTPSICVAPNGVIHVAFIEQHSKTYKNAVYHRMSSDGGKTWSGAKNLSDVLPEYQPATVKVLADAAGRVYVIWRTGLNEGFTVEAGPHSIGPNANLIYRVWQNGAWNGKAVHVHTPGTYAKQDDGSASWFAATGPDGKVHVQWVVNPDYGHPELMSGKPGDTYRQHNNGVNLGSVMETVLSGSDPGTPRELFMAKITVKDGDNIYGHACDGFDTINGYVDASGRPIFLAKVYRSGDVYPTGNPLALIENDTQTEVLRLPGETFRTWTYPPTLLLDARGKRHIIAMYESGEQPEVRDYLIGGGGEPTVVRAAKEIKGTLSGFEAYQGTGGRMIAVMAMNDTGKDGGAELYVSTSDGGKWSSPVNVTNNAGHSTSTYKATSRRSSVGSYSYWYPGPAAAAFDKTGHLVLVHVSNEHSVFGGSAFGVQTFGGSTSKPTLLFVRF